jgi:hypothetical protein
MSFSGDGERKRFHRKAAFLANRLKTQRERERERDTHTHTVRHREKKREAGELRFNKMD